MSRKPQPILDTDLDREQKIEAVLAVMLEEWCPCGEPYEGYIGFKRGTACAMVDRDIHRLRELVYEEYVAPSRAAFERVSGLRLNMRRPGQAFTKIRKWCGLSDAWEVAELARIKVSTEYDKLTVKIGSVHTENKHSELKRLLSEGWLVLVDTPSGERLLKAEDTDGSYFQVTGPEAKKLGYFPEVRGLLHAMLKSREADAVYAKEQDRKHRCEIVSRIKPGLQATTAPFFFL
jgi:hypothetical protein